MPDYSVYREDLILGDRNTIWAFVSEPKNLCKWVETVCCPGFWINEGNSKQKGSRFSVGFSGRDTVEMLLFELTETTPGLSLTFKCLNSESPFSISFHITQSELPDHCVMATTINSGASPCLNAN